MKSWKTVRRGEFDFWLGGRDAWIWFDVTEDEGAESGRYKDSEMCRRDNVVTIRVELVPNGPTGHRPCCLEFLCLLQQKQP